MLIMSLALVFLLFFAAGVIAALFFQLKNRWFWLIYEPAGAMGKDAIRQQLYRLKDVIRMP